MREPAAALDVGASSAIYSKPPSLAHDPECGRLLRTRCR
jgi:hypothetical protein